MYCNTNQFTEKPFCSPYPNPRGSRGLSKRYHLRFDPKLGHSIRAICRIPFACVACTSMLDQPWISGISSKKQSHYQPVTNFTYWSVPGSFNNSNIIHLSHISTPFELF